jgi:hypothetical protein
MRFYFYSINSCKATYENGREDEVGGGGGKEGWRRGGRGRWVLEEGGGGGVSHKSVIITETYLSYI